MSQHAVACAVLDEEAMGGISLACCTDFGHMHICLPEHVPEHPQEELAHNSAATMGYVYTIFRIFIVFAH